jgi:FixJ family two-component response regulator
VTAPAAPLVFIVDDDASVRRGLARLVRTAGFDVETFASAGEFLACPATQVSLAWFSTCGCPA